MRPRGLLPFRSDAGAPGRQTGARGHLWTRHVQRRTVGRMGTTLEQWLDELPPITNPTALRVVMAVAFRAINAPEPAAVEREAPANIA